MSRVLSEINRGAIVSGFLIIFSVFVLCARRDKISINDGWTFRYGDNPVSEPVHLPHCWNDDAYSTRDYKRGAGVYARTLFIPEYFRNRRVYLRLDGAATQSIIMIDGKTVSGHIGSYSPHMADITDFVSPGQTHSLLVEVDNSSGSIPPYSADFTIMGGLYRDAWIVLLPELHFGVGPEMPEGFKATPVYAGAGKGKMRVEAQIVNTLSRKATPHINFELRAPDGSLVAEKEKVLHIPAASVADVDIIFDNLEDLTAWCPEEPSLYTLTGRISERGSVIDENSAYTGFRTFGFGANGEFLLNGRPYKLRGMCRHQDQKPAGIALSDEQHRRDMRLIKDVGANFVRISHYPQDDAVLEMCDRLGLIAWEEIPVIDYVPEDSLFAENAESMLREMIRHHYNHPSVAMWGYMNEILLRVPQEEKETASERTMSLAARLERVLREEDETRLSTMAFHGSDIYHEAGLGEVTDVKGWNLYQGWYGGRLEDFESFLSRQHIQHPSHRIIVSEYGAGSDRRLHSLKPRPFDFSVEYQQKYLEHYLPVIEDSVFVAGASHWNFIDFSSAGREESMPRINNKGLVTNDRRLKDVYYYYKAKWHDLSTDTVAYIAVRDWDERSAVVDRNGCVTHPVKVYTNLPKVRLKVNGEASRGLEVSNCTAILECSLKNGKNIIELLDCDDGNHVMDVAVINMHAFNKEGELIDPGTGELAINVGSDCYYRSDTSGVIWLPDSEYSAGEGYGHVGGKRISSQNEIGNTSDHPLFQHCLTGIEEYRIDVVPGNYEIELGFAELSSERPQSAYMLGHGEGNGDIAWGCMDIAVNGRTVERNFSPGSDCGPLRMIKRVYRTEVKDKSGLKVSFSPVNNMTTLLSGIKIRKL